MPTLRTTTYTDARHYDTKDNHHRHPSQTTTTTYTTSEPRQPHRTRSGDSMPSLNRKPSTTRFAAPMPTRSASTDSYPPKNNPRTTSHQPHNHHHFHYDPAAEPDFASLPPNAFNIMHAWELESLEKWQSRLEQVRKDQKVLKARVEGLRQEEERLYAENAKGGASARKPPTTQPQPQRKRSTSSFTSTSESEIEYESVLPRRRTSSGNLRAQHHPNGPTYYQQRSRSNSNSTSTRPTDDFNARMQSLYVELAALQDQLAVCGETEDKATRGIRKATTRLERLRTLEERWKVPGPEDSPPMSRAPSPKPQQQQQANAGSRPNSRSPPTSRRNSNDATAGATPPTSGAQPRRPTRTASFTFEFRRGSTATFTSSKTRGSESTSKTGGTSGATTTKQPLQNSSRASAIDPWLSYEDRWHQLNTQSSLALRFSSIPWPMCAQPSAPEKITSQAIREFLLNPKNVRASAAKINTSGSSDAAKSAKDEAKARRALLRAALLRWHPDKFLSKYLEWVEEGERAAVKEGVGKVVCCLNEIMRMEDARARMMRS